MMYFEYHKKSEEVLLKAKKSNSFPLFQLSDESILARYYLCCSFEKTFGYIPVLETDPKGKPLPIHRKNGENIYWSISHTKNYIAFMICENECGIDIAELDERDASILSSHTEEEYAILGSKNWENFYILWTAKEALIKKCGTSLEDMNLIHLVSKDGNSYSFEFAHKTHTIYTEFNAPLFISYTV